MKRNLKKLLMAGAGAATVYGAYSLGAQGGVSGAINKLKTFAQARRANKRLAEEAAKDGFTKYKNLSGDNSQFAVVAGGNSEINASGQGIIPKKGLIEEILSLIGLA